MNYIAQILQSALVNMWSVLLQSTIQSVVILLLVFGALYFVRRQSAAGRHYLMMVVITGLLLLPVLGKVVPKVSVPVVFPETVLNEVVGGGKNIERNVLTPLAGVSAEAVRSSDTDTTAASNTSFTFNWRAIAGSFWILISLGLLTRIVVAHLRANLLVSGANAALQEDAPLWHAELARHFNELRAQKQPRVIVCDAIESPVVFGYLNPVLLLPKQALDWTREQVGPTVIHELAHLERGDLWKRVVVQIACALYWPNPLMWVIAEKMFAEAEQACDDQVITRGVTSSSYAQILLEATQDVKLAQVRRPSMASPLVTSPFVQMASGEDFKDRVLNILDPAVRRNSLNKKGAVLTICFATILVVAPVVLQPLNSSFASAVSSSSKTIDQPSPSFYNGPDHVEGLADVVGDMGYELGAIRDDFVRVAKKNIVTGGVTYLVYTRHEKKLDDLIDNLDRAMYRDESVETAYSYLSQIVQEHLDIGVTALKMLPESAARQELKNNLLVMYRDMNDVALELLGTLPSVNGNRSLKTAAKAVYTDLANWTRWAYEQTEKT